MSPPQPAAPAGPSSQKPTVAPAQLSAASRRDWFAIPTPLRRLFRLFPLVTYAPNELPTRSPPHRHLPTLYVFVSDRQALEGLPSYNPSCLKWQTFLKLAGVEFRLVSSSNHASPTGALPFLIPPSTPGDADSQRPVPSNKLEKYALHKGSRRVPEVSASRLDAYQALLDHRIRNAWLYALYLSGPNSGLLHQLYVGPVSASRPVQATVLYQLRQAAEAEILQSIGATRVSSEALYTGAEQAFEALTAALGTDDWFFANTGAGLFDAAVFAYTHLLLDEELGWVDTRLRDALLRFPALVEHRNRLYDKCWGKNNA